MASAMSSEGVTMLYLVMAGLIAACMWLVAQERLTVGRKARLENELRRAAYKMLIANGIDEPSVRGLKEMEVQMHIHPVYVGQFSSMSRPEGW